MGRSSEQHVPLPRLRGSDGRLGVAPAPWKALAPHPGRQEGWKAQAGSGWMTGSSIQLRMREAGLWSPHEGAGGRLSLGPPQLKE